MTDLAATVLSPALLAPRTAAPQVGTMSASEAAKRLEIDKTAKKFEASFLNIMLQQMFDGVQTAAPFGGGPGEEMFKSFMTDAMASKMVQAGGVGVAASVSREMLKLQGLK